MDTDEGELQEALDALLAERLAGDQAIKGWYDTIIRYAAIGVPSYQRMATEWYRRQRASGKLYSDTASETGVKPMPLVIGTVGNIDPNSICEDAECAQRGELMKDHAVTHKNKPGPKGQRGICPHCQGHMHNSNDAGQLIAFQCLWKQVYGDMAKKIPVNGVSLGKVAQAINNGSVTAWADRALTLTAAPPAPVAVPKAPAPGPAVGVAPVTAPVTTAAPVAPSGPAPVVSDKAVLTDEEKAKRKAAMQAALKGARVLPS